MQAAAAAVAAEEVNTKTEKCNYAAAVDRKKTLLRDYYTKNNSEFYEQLRNFVNNETIKTLERKVKEAETYIQALNESKRFYWNNEIFKKR